MIERTGLCVQKRHSLKNKRQLDLRIPPSFKNLHGTRYTQRVVPSSWLREGEGRRNLLTPLKQTHPNLSPPSVGKFPSLHPPSSESSWLDGRFTIFTKERVWNTLAEIFPPSSTRPPVVPAVLDTRSSLARAASAVGMKSVKCKPSLVWPLSKLAGGKTQKCFMAFGACRTLVYCSHR